jgi:hypothetical protein
VFPALERALDYTTRVALTLVTGHCTPAAIRQAGQQGLSEYLRAQRAHRASIPGTGAQKPWPPPRRTPWFCPPQPPPPGWSLGLARRLLDLDREIKDLDKLIADRFRTHPQAEIIESLPGMGPIFGAEFLAITGGDLAAFGTPARLATYAGLAPVPHDSGRRTGVRHPPGALPPQTAPRVLPGRLLQPAPRPALAAVLPAQTLRATTPRQSHDRPRPPTG